MADQNQIKSNMSLNIEQLTERND